jgi:DNA-binding IclR family transcriptional regulator
VSNVPAAANALEVLRLLGARAAPVPAAAIAAELKLPRSTVYHLLKVLQAHGFVVHLPAERRYGLGAAALELGSAYSRQEPLRWIARSVLARLVSETGHSGHFVTLDGRDAMYLVEERAPGRPSLVTDVGVRLPAYLTASGLAMLAALPPAQVRALWPSRADLSLRTAAGPRSLTELRAMLVETRRRGYAIENGTVTAGLASVAAPVLEHNGFPLAAVALTYSVEDVDEPAAAALARSVIDAATAIARQIRGGTQAQLIR